MDRNVIGWFEIPVNEMDRAVRFYNHIFDITLTQMSSGALEMSSFPFVQGAYGASGALVKNTDFYKPSTEGVVIYFATDDIPKVLAAVIEAGGTVLQEKKQISPTAGYMGLFLDSEGNRIALHSNA